MKSSGFVTGLLLLGLPLFSQEGPQTTAVPNLQITEISLEDQNGNMTIEATETCNLKFLLENTGNGPAKSVRIKITHFNPESLNIKYKKSRSLLIVKANSSKEVIIPISAGENIPEGSVEFRIEALEPNGFDAYPANIEIKTAQGNIIQNTFSAQPKIVLQELEDTSNLVIRDIRFVDPNQNNILEPYETAFIQFRLYNLGDEDVNGILVHIEQNDGNTAGISYSKSLNLGYYPSYYMQEISIPIKGNKNLTDSQAEITVYLSEEGGIVSNYHSVSITTRKYESPDLKIVKAEFISQDGKEIRLNHPINLNLEIKNAGKGTAHKVYADLKILYEDVRLINSKPRIRIEEIQGGESQEISFQIMASSEYFLPELPVSLQLTENISNFFLDTMFMTSIHFPEVKKIVAADPALTQTDKPEDIQQKEIKTTISQVALPNLELYSQEFIDDDKNKIINFGESCIIKFKVRNSGSGPAEEVTVNIKQLNGDIKGLSFPESFNLGLLGPDQEQEVSIPIISTERLVSDNAQFRIDVLESRGFDAVPLVFEVKTQKLLEPDLSISQAEFINESGALRRNYPIELKISVTNTGPGKASDIKVQFELPDVNCVLLGENDTYDLETLNSGESKIFSLLFTATRRFTADQIPVKVEITESHRKYGIDTTLVGDLNADALAITKHEVQPRIIEQPAINEQPTDNQVVETRGGGDPLKGLGYEEAIREMKIGKYFALIIGIDSYTGVWPPLKNAVHDAKAVEEMLGTKYMFDHFRTLYDDMATRKNIIRELEWLADNVAPDDNVLIFYSGHGEFKKQYNRGYWVPIEAQTTSTYDYISNSVIQDFLRSMNSKHTLLISDACFSGDIFRGNTISIPFERSERYYRTVHMKASRQAITSGGLEPVMDGGRDGHSVFSYYLLKSLDTNPDKFFDASQLYNDLKIPVVNNSEQSPEFQHLKNTGDEGGQFIFIQK